MRTLKPLRNLLLLQPAPHRVLSDGGLHLVGYDPIINKKFKVLAVGPKVRDIVPGDYVLTGGAGVIEHEWTDGVRLMPQTEVIAVWNDPAGGNIPGLNSPTN